MSACRSPRAGTRPPNWFTGAQAVIKSLEALGVDVVFGFPGGAIMPAYDPLIDAELLHVLVRHEQGAVHMAEGYAHATGRVGVCIVTSGPAATNLVTGLADAHMDSIPILAITGQVPHRDRLGRVPGGRRDRHHVPITKHNELVHSPERSPAHQGGLPRGPVRAPGPGAGRPPEGRAQRHRRLALARQVDLPGYRPTVRGHGKMIREALELIAGGTPVIYAGGGRCARARPRSCASSPTRSACRS